MNLNSITQMIEDQNDRPYVSAKWRLFHFVIRFAIRFWSHFQWYTKHIFIKNHQTMSSSIGFNKIGKRWPLTILKSFFLFAAFTNQIYKGRRQEVKGTFQWISCTICRNVSLDLVSPTQAPKISGNRKPAKRLTVTFDQKFSEFEN